MTGLRRITPLALLLVALALPASAECLAEYKAKRDDPLRLDYGVRRIPDSACTPERARAILEPELAAEGWTLLNIVSVQKSDRGR